jgi:hypothetical protein
MGFEKIVLNKVEEVLGESRKASFYNGTLFIETSQEKAQEVFDELSLTYGPIELNGPIAGEFAYDFV